MNLSLFYRVLCITAFLSLSGPAQALDPFAPRPWFLYSRVLLEEGEEEAGLEGSIPVLP